MHACAVLFVHGNERNGVVDGHIMFHFRRQVARLIARRACRGKLCMTTAIDSQSTDGRYTTTVSLSVWSAVQRSAAVAVWSLASQLVSSVGRSVAEIQACATRRS